MIVQAIVASVFAIQESKYKKALSAIETSNYIEAFDILSELENYRDSSQLLSNIKTKAYNAMISDADIGDRLFFGSYEQDGKKENGEEDIEWLVLDKKDDKLLVISKYCLKEAAFDSEYYEEQTWATSDIRRWLNEGGFDFLAFTTAERSKIIPTNITTPKNSKYGTNGGSNTLDKIFLLSIEEAEQYFASDNDRKTLATDSSTFDSIEQPYSCGWWLRSNGYNDDKSSAFYDSYAACVDASGSVNYKGEIVKYDAGIRPAMWIDISSYIN